MSRILHVWMNGENVGSWKVDRGSHSFTYSESWTRSEKVRSLSLSMPVTSARLVRGPRVASFFDNLLPDNDKIRERLGRRFSTKDTEAFSLLEAIGRDCVGAVQLLPEDAVPEGWDRIECEVLSEHDVSDILRRVPTDGPLGGRGGSGFRISLAGAQEKTALLKKGNRWCEPRGATPTTHILKLPLGVVGGSQRIDLSDSVYNEWLCARLLEALGLSVANSEVLTFEDQQVLVVERFDRRMMADERWIARLPQEDFCQALGLPPSKKYEVDGGPNMIECLRLIDGSSDAGGDRTQFLLAQLGFWILAACDGHAKNFSIFLRPRDDYVMTPLYDVISFWPYFGKSSSRLDRKRQEIAMAVRSKNTHRLLDSIQTRHWHNLAMSNGGAETWEAMVTLVESLEPALQAVEDSLPNGVPPRTWDAIATGARSQAKRFREGQRSIDKGIR